MRRRLVVVMLGAVLLAACASEAEPAAPEPTFPPMLPPSVQKGLDQTRDRLAARADWHRRAGKACEPRHLAMLRADRAFHKLDDQWDKTSEPSAAWKAALAKLEAAQNAEHDCIDNFEGGGPPGPLDP